MSSARRTPSESIAIQRGQGMWHVACDMWHVLYDYGEKLQIASYFDCGGAGMVDMWNPHCGWIWWISGFLKYGGLDGRYGGLDGRYGVER